MREKISIFADFVAIFVQFFYREFSRLFAFGITLFNDDVIKWCLPQKIISDVTRPLKVGGCKICEKSDGLGCRSFDTAVAV